MTKDEEFHCLLVGLVESTRDNEMDCKYVIIIVDVLSNYFDYDGQTGGHPAFEWA